MFPSIKRKIALSVIPKNLAFYFLNFDIKSNFAIQQGTIIFSLSNMWFMVENRAFVRFIYGNITYEVELLLQMLW
jgi:hypothetical protein